VNSLASWILTKLSPEEVQKESAFEDIEAALQNRQVQKRWLESMIGKIQVMNAELDHLLADPDKTRKWETFAIERRTLLRSLTMILDARDSIETDRFEQAEQDKMFERFKGAHAPLDLRANNEG
jgi:hypothetical protein